MKVFISFSFCRNSNKKTPKYPQKFHADDFLKGEKQREKGRT